LTGAVASQRVTEAPQGALSPVGNRAERANPQARPTARETSRAGPKGGVSDPAATVWNGRRLTDKSYPGDNRLIGPKSSLRRPGLAPRCRLIASWRGIAFQGFGCSPIKAVRELGSKRRETVWSLSVVGAGGLRGPSPSTQGLGRTRRRCAGCSASCTAGQPPSGRISAESI
jgi:hypothetical protein